MTGRRSAMATLHRDAGLSRRVLRLCRLFPPNPVLAQLRRLPRDFDSIEPRSVLTQDLTLDL